MGSENVIITGNQVASNNQFTSGGRGFNPLVSKDIQFGRVVEVFPDRSIRFEIIQNSFRSSKLRNKTAATGIAYNFNPNFTRLPEKGELVPLIKGPNNKVGNSANQYDQATYYILGPISVQQNVDDNKVPQDNQPPKKNDLLDYKLNEIGVNKPVPGQAVPSPPPSITTTPTPNPNPSVTPTPTETPTPTSDPRGTFIENYTNRAGQEFELYWKRSGFGIETSAYKKGTNNAVASNKLNADASNQQQIINLTASSVKLTLQDNIYP